MGPGCFAAVKPPAARGWQSLGVPRAGTVSLPAARSAGAAAGRIYPAGGGEAGTAYPCHGGSPEHPGKRQGRGLSWERGRV